jgi:adenosylcobinamide-GDP ribazoletransferase
MPQFLRHYLLAIQFFTRIPVTGRLGDWVGFSPAMLRASAAHFPGVGWLVGGGVAGFTALGVLMTGAFHEDGLADVADGLGGSQDRERALTIMKDSRVGAFGAIAVVLVLMGSHSVGRCGLQIQATGRPDHHGQPGCCIFLVF